MYFIVLATFIIISNKYSLDIQNNISILIIFGFSIVQFIYAAPLLYYWQEKKMTRSVIGGWIGVALMIILNLVWLDMARSY
ncbi:hypothetical protein MAIT1_01003 [Magnetofaba australis IT-1]|uniref:Uncharacterized protein n=1 Tax=Magnetofaba australis IT-1 TaxID=1434232 RepID=A0A1Y2K0Z2_9PROT|nr:hypothetical protein MAIT1_01003 [Magnetofaba australis IT-1]